MMPNSCEEQQQQGRQSLLSIDPSTILDSSNYFVKFKSNNDNDDNIDDIPINNYGQESLNNDNINLQKFCNHKLISQNESDPFETIRAQYTEHLQLDRSHSNNNENKKQAKIDSKTLEQLRLDSVKNRLLTKLNLEIPPKTTDITEADREEIRELIRRTGLEMIGTTDQHQHRKRRHRKSLISSADEFHSNDDFDEYDDDEDDSHEEYKKEASEMVIFAEPVNQVEEEYLP
ncbi:hypothetical protein DERP_003878 [Dermatophagoides pteronyssinus]|uniref:Uncharacterized protein n=1 Tax=Dermatophagoides pteronyssinus TaxID=6956 RepID=A0ABQ8J7J2_DERPT|nr:hypothetical protein DERP_003878 [Dermatophagoides pteronyssinus]